MRKEKARSRREKYPSSLVRLEGGESERCGSLHWQKPKYDYETSPQTEDGDFRGRQGVRTTAQSR